jgi:CubicO group peptidase (beta-lactamase class C family)
MKTSVSRRWVLTALSAGTGASVLGACAARKSRSAQRELALASDIDAAVERAIALDLVPGMSVAVYSREGVHVRGYGFADIDTRERSGAETAYYIASSTKSMTALALTCLHTRRELDLDATLAEIAPQAPLPPAARPGEVHLRQMLAHVGGIANEPIEYRFTSTGQHDPATLWRLLAASEENAAAPLGKFQYANISYNIATILTDRRLGVRWQDLLHEEVAEPAGLTRTTTSMSRAKASGWSIAKPHRLGPAGTRERSYLEKTDQTMHSAGGVIMSAQDAARWLELIIEDGRVGGRRCLPPEAVHATRQPIAAVDAQLDGYRREAYGLGWYIGPYRNERMLHHFGGFSGFRAHVSYLPAQAIGVAVFTNDSTVGLRVINAIANHVYDRAGGYPDAAERLSAALDACTASYRDAARRVVADRASRAGWQFALARAPAAYAGSYENELWGRIDIGVQDSTLHVACGVLRAVAEPLDKTDAVWVELEPGQGTALQFEGDGAAPAALSLEGRRFQRTS